jgi:uncharacterized membrane protein
MEGFSDGVFGFAMTLLVVDLAIHPPGGALHQFLQGWPSYLAYLVSFLTIGGAWLGHVTLTDRLTVVDALFLRINLLVLLVVVFLPFPTRLVAQTLRSPGSERVFITVYGLTLLAIRLLAIGLDSYAWRQHLYSRHGDDEELRTDQRKSLPIIIGYVIAILIGLAWPGAGIAVYLAVAVYLFVPFRELAKTLFRSRRVRERAP